MAERPALRAALSSALEHGAGVLIVEEPGRLARDEDAAHDALRSFGNVGVRVLYADGRNASRAADPASRLQDGFHYLLAAYDRRVIVARMADGRIEGQAHSPLACSGREAAARVPSLPLRRRRG